MIPREDLMKRKEQFNIGRLIDDTFSETLGESIIEKTKGAYRL